MVIETYDNAEEILCLIIKRWPESEQKKAIEIHRKEQARKEKEDD